jgi:hypothetical protein
MPIGRLDSIASSYPRIFCIHKCWKKIDSNTSRSSVFSMRTVSCQSGSSDEEIWNRIFAEAAAPSAYSPERSFPGTGLLYLVPTSGRSTLPAMTDLGKVASLKPIRNKDNCRSYRLAPNIIFGKAPKATTGRPTNRRQPEP